MICVGRNIWVPVPRQQGGCSGIIPTVAWCWHSCQFLCARDTNEGGGARGTCVYVAADHSYTSAHYRQLYCSSTADVEKGGDAALLLQEQVMTDSVLFYIIVYYSCIIKLANVQAFEQLLTNASLYCNLKQYLLCCIVGFPSCFNLHHVQS